MTIRAESNALLASLTSEDRKFLGQHSVPLELNRGQILYEPGDDVVTTYFPDAGTIVSLVVCTSGNHGTEAVMIGYEGAAGGVVSAGHRPASTRMVVTAGGGAIQIATDRLEEAKSRSPQLHEVFSRYADLLLAQAMQSIACSAMHTLDQRLCRWLLMMHDRVATPGLSVTQELLAEMLGVQRTTVSAAAQELQRQGFIEYRRGQIAILNRSGLESASCECYAAVEKHFYGILPAIVDTRQERAKALAR
jgi:CRP-like cAMP-binding protein